MLALAATTLSVAGLAATTSPVAAKPKPDSKGDVAKARFFSFNDFHGALDAPGGSGAAVNGVPAGGAEYLATTLEEACGPRPTPAGQKTLTVGAGDMVGATPLLSAAFHDEPSIETLNLLKMDVTSVGNHEFDEGVDELLRLQNGGCHPTDGCQDGDPFYGADFPYLAANTVYKDTGKTILPAWTTRVVQGVPRGLHRHDARGHAVDRQPGRHHRGQLPRRDRDRQQVRRASCSTRASRPSSCSSTRAVPQAAPPAAIDPSGCANFAGPLTDIVAGLDPEFDLVVSGHTHRPYVCSLPDSGRRVDPDDQRRHQRPAGHRHHRDAEQVRPTTSPASARRNVIVENGIKNPDGTYQRTSPTGPFVLQPGPGRPGDEDADRRVPRRRRADRQPHRRRRSRPTSRGRRNAAAGDRPRGRDRRRPAGLHASRPVRRSPS